jgi:hypothetical protein
VMEGHHMRFVFRLVIGLHQVMRLSRIVF